MEERTPSVYLFTVLFAYIKLFVHLFLFIYLFVHLSIYLAECARTTTNCSASVWQMLHEVDMDATCRAKIFKINL